ncbi:ABC transporter substrate-binding protein [Nocardioides coralli]|uniref:ABC transporter substrate-binding protein n=1 Tax=Nocardioides coralli TaxID=2872154 RepID=UPI001CA39357|nr:ABC transporter substrate-binding protein [Nocardioides coralli]QZY30603.1 ABC transporter substrate-binding protein [Nocardioides coralli]
MTGLVLALLAPAAVLSSATAAEEEVTFTVALDNEVDSFNPFLGIEVESFEMWGLMYDSLTTYTMDDLTPAPSLATEWESSEDGLTWTYTVRDDVTWSDGEPLTAQDIAYTFGRIVDGGPERATWGSFLGGVESVTAPDDTTVVLELKRPSSVLPALPVPIVPEHVWTDVSEEQVKAFSNEPEDGEPVVGSGPFRLVEGTAGGSTYRFEVNPDYWKGTPHLDEVVFRVFKSDDAAAQALLKGEVDFVEDLSAIQVRALEGRDGITAVNAESAGFDEIAFNAGSVDLETGEPMGDPNPAVLDPAFRYALGFAVDREQIVEKAYQGAGTPGSTIVPPALPAFHWEPPEDDAFTFDLERAAELLDEAGYTVGDDGFRTLPSGEPIGTLRLFARSDSKVSTDVLTFFQEWLSEIDIDAEVRAVESNKLTDIILAGEFDVFEWGWFLDPDPDSMLSYMTCDQRGNWSDTWYCDEECDRLYEEQKSESDPDARAEMVQRMQEILYYDAPYLVTAYSTIGEAWRSDRFACMRPQPDPGGVYLIQASTYNYLHMRPASEAEECAGEDGVTQASDAAGDDGPGTGLAIGAGAGLLVLLGLGAVVMLRRRATVEDRE